MACKLPLMPCACDALAPRIDVLAMKIHHGRHLRTYIDKFNAALQGAGSAVLAPVGPRVANRDARPEALRAAERNIGPWRRRPGGISAFCRVFDRSEVVRRHDAARA